VGRVKNLEKGGVLTERVFISRVQRTWRLGWYGGGEGIATEVAKAGKRMI